MHCFSKAFVQAVSLEKAEPKSNKQAANAKDKIIYHWMAYYFIFSLFLS